MHVRRFATFVEILTPAKINLFLEVLARRPDGYHDIETMLAAVTVYDRLTLRPTSEGTLNLRVRWAMGLPAARELLYGEISCGSENLVWRAVRLLKERSGATQGAAMELVKHIPAAAGLGGASSDAAAALVAANAAWQLDWPRERLIELAAELGSDVPFFLSRGMAVCRGRGEQMEAASPARLHLVIVKPPVGLSTPAVYKRCQPTANRIGVETLRKPLVIGNAAEVSRRMINTLEPAAAELTPWIATLRAAFEKQDVLGHQMSGSGSSYFGLCRSARHARRVASRLRSMKLGAVFFATTAVAC